MERVQFEYYECYGCMDGRSETWECPQCGRTIKEAPVVAMPVSGSLPHIHEAGKNGDIDECNLCKHDLRHEIHKRL